MTFNECAGEALGLTAEELTEGELLAVE